MVNLLEGEWRMYCKPVEGPGFSYGMYITDVQQERTEGHSCSYSFKGRSRVEGVIVTLGPGSRWARYCDREVGFGEWDRQMECVGESMGAGHAASCGVA